MTVILNSVFNRVIVPAKCFYASLVPDKRNTETKSLFRDFFQKKQDVVSYMGNAINYVWIG